jgi:chemotaxis protein histidine kinase CheA
MATEVQIRLTTEGIDKAQQDIDNLERSINKTKGTTNEMSQSVDALDGVFSAFGSNAIGDFKALQQSGSNLLKNFGTLRKTGIKGLITGFKGLKMAIASTGIGLLLTLLPDLINAIASWIQGTDKAAEAQARLNAQIEAHRNINQQVLADFDKISAIEAIRGQTEQERIKRSRERLELERKQLEIDDQRLIAAQANAAAIRDEDEREEALDKAKADRQANQNRRYQIERELEINTAKLKAQIRKEGEEANAKLEQQAEERAKKAKERADAEKARLQALQALRQQARQRELQEQQDFEAQLEQMEEEAFLRTLSDEEREVLAVQDKYFQLITEAEQFNMDTLFLEEEQQLALKEIRDRYAAERAEQEAAEQEERDKQREKERAALQEQLDEEIAARQALNDDIAGMTGDAFQVLADIRNASEGEDEEAQKRTFERNKRLSIAQALITTFQAVNQQLAVPQDALTGMNFVKAGIALAAGLANVTKISQTQFESASASGSSSSGLEAAAGTSAQQTLTPITGESIDTTGAVQPVQAYVIGQDITNQQALDSELRLRSTL